MSDLKQKAEEWASRSYDPQGAIEQQMPWTDCKEAFLAGAESQAAEVERLKAEVKRLEEWQDFALKEDGDILKVRSELETCRERCRKRTEYAAADLQLARADLQSSRDQVERYQSALMMFSNRRKLAYSLRADCPQIYAFVEAIGVEIDKILASRSPDPGKESE